MLEFVLERLRKVSSSGDAGVYAAEDRGVSRCEGDDSPVRRRVEGALYVGNGGSKGVDIYEVEPRISPEAGEEEGIRLTLDELTSPEQRIISGALLSYL